MPYAIYRRNILSLANDEMEGEDISEGIAALAAESDVEEGMIRQEVTEALDLL